jgi:hypothetical protein
MFGIERVTLSAARLRDAGDAVSPSAGERVGNGVPNACHIVARVVTACQYISIR